MKSKSQTFKALIEQPEKLSVGDLNQAIKDLRELLYQKEFRSEGYHETFLKFYFNTPPKTDVTPESLDLEWRQWEQDQWKKIQDNNPK